MIDSLFVAEKKCLMFGMILKVTEGWIMNDPDPDRMGEVVDPEGMRCLSIRVVLDLGMVMIIDETDETMVQMMTDGFMTTPGMMDVEGGD